MVGMNQKMIKVFGDLYEMNNSNREYLEKPRPNVLQQTIHENGENPSILGRKKHYKENKLTLP